MWGGGAAEELARDTLPDHETYANHFRHVCKQQAGELTRRAFSAQRVAIGNAAARSVEANTNFWPKVALRTAMGAA
jgi:hypothetical protein